MYVHVSETTRPAFPYMNIMEHRGSGILRVFRRCKGKYG